MGIFDVTGRLSGKNYSVKISGEAPSATELARIQQYVADQEGQFATKYKQQFGQDLAPRDDGTALGRGWASGMQSAKGGLGELLQTTGNRLGWSGLEDYGTGVETAAAKQAARLSLEQPAALGWRDVKGLGTGLTYLGEMAGSSAPIMGAGVVGAGLGTLAAAAAPELAIGAGVAGAIGAGLATVPFYAGENLQEQEKVSGEGNVNLTKALATGAFQSALDAASLKVLGRLGVGKAALAALEGETGQKLTSRLLTGAVNGTLAEGGTEAVQELATMWQAGVDLNSPEAQDRLLGAFVGGGVLGGVIGGAGRGAFGKRAEAAVPKPNDEVVANQTKEDKSKAPALAPGEEQGTLFSNLLDQRVPDAWSEIPEDMRPEQGRLQFPEAPRPLLPSERADAQTEMGLVLPEGAQGELFGNAPPVGRPALEVLDALGVGTGAPIRKRVATAVDTDERFLSELAKYAKVPGLTKAARAPITAYLAKRSAPAPVPTPKPNTAVVAEQEAQDQVKAPAKEPVLKAGRRAKPSVVVAPVAVETPTAPDTSGWKLHLNPAPGSEQAISDYLTEKGVPHKVGQASGQVGKGMTVYVGAKDAATTLASDLDTRFSESLKDAEGDVLTDDTPLAGKVWGRFDIGNKDKEFHQYGESGVPYLAEDMGQLNYAEDRAVFGTEAFKRADALLKQRYGEFYTGTAPAATKEAAPEAVDALEVQVNEVVQKPIVPAPVAPDETPAAPAPAAEIPNLRAPVVPQATPQLKPGMEIIQAGQLIPAPAVRPTTPDSVTQRRRDKLAAITAEIASLRERIGKSEKAPKVTQDEAKALGIKPGALRAKLRSQFWALEKQRLELNAALRNEADKAAVAGIQPVRADKRSDSAAIATLLEDAAKNRHEGFENKEARGAAVYFSKMDDATEALRYIAADAAMPGIPKRYVSTAQSPLPAYAVGAGKTPATAAVAWVKANLSPEAVAYLEKEMASYTGEAISALSTKIDTQIKSERARNTEAALEEKSKFWQRYEEGAKTDREKGLFKRAAQSIAFGLEEALHPAIVAALRAGNLRDALEGISLTSADPYVRNMAAKLMAFVGTTKVYTTYNNAEATRMLQNKADPSRRNHGAYMLMSKEDYDAVAAKYPAYAAYIQNAIFLDESTGMDAHTLLHEMVHAATAQELLRNPTGPVAMRLEALRKDALKQLGALEYDPDLHSYGFADVYEFASEVLSNQDFQMELDRIFPNDRKASGLVQFMQEFANFVRRILGRPAKDYRGTSTFDEADFFAQSIFNVAPEFGGSQPLYSRAMQPTKAKQVLTAVGKLAGPFAEVDSLQTARAVSRSVLLDMTRPAMPAILNLFTPVRNLVTLAEKYFPETAMAVYASLAGQKSFEQSLNTEIANTMKQVEAFLKASPEKAATFHSFRTRASRYEIDVRRPLSFYSKYSLGYYPLKADGTPGARVFEEFDSFEDRKAKIDALNKAEAAGAQHTRARAVNDPDPETLKLYKALRKEYESLGKAGQDAYNQVLGVFEAMHYETAKAVKDRINAMLPDTADVDNAQTRNILLRSIYNKIFAEKGLMVYQPLQRSGEFKLTYNGIHPTTNTTENFVHSFDTAAQRDKALDLLRALPKEFNISNIETPLQKIGDPFGSRRSPPPAFVADVTRLITKGAQQDAAAARKRILAQGGTSADADAEYQRVLTEVTSRAESNNRAIVELALDAMPESSIFNAYRARQNVSGFVGDLSPLKTAFDAIEGSFDSVDTSSTLLQTKLSSMVHQVSAIRHQAESAKIMAAMTAQMELIRTTMPEDAATARVYYDTLAESLKNPTIRRSKLAAGANTGAFVWTLFGNVSSAAVNTMGIMLVVYPRLAARYGAVKAAKIMLRSLRDIANSGRSRMEPVIGPDGKRTMQAVDTGAVGRSVRNYTFGDVDFAQGYTTGANDTNTLKYLVDEGMQRHMFVDSSIYDYLDSNKSGLGAFADKMLHLGAAPMHHTERIIRESTMIANYRLELQAAAKRKGTAVLTEQDMQAAAKFAVEQTELMTGTTPSTAAPNWAQKGIMPMIAMYKRYPLAMMHLLLGDISNALPGKAKLEAIHGAGTEAFKNALESRKIARLQVAGQFGALALFSGAMGLPLYGMFSDVFDAMFTDDDEEKFDFLVRRNLGELGSKGILNYLLGVDIASRIGMSDIFYRAPLRAADQKFSQNILEGAMGPAAGLITGTLPRAMDLYNQGEYFRALEAAMPAAVRNGLRAYRFATTGSAESLRGDVISDIGPGSVLAQALGFAPAAYVRQLELSSAAKQIDVAIATKKSALLRRMNLARRNRDRVETQAILADINEFNRKHPSKRITADTIRRSANTFETTTSRVRNGVVYSDLGLPELRPAFDMMDEPVTIWD